MKKDNKSLKNHALQKKVKDIIKKSKKLDLIKSHTEAFKINPVEEEEHKGKIKSFKK